MKKLALTLLTLSLIGLVSGCASKPIAVAVDLGCTEYSRYHTTDAQRAGVKADPTTWYPLFQWLASFDAVYDKRCK